MQWTSCLRFAIQPTSKKYRIEIDGLRTHLGFLQISENYSNTCKLDDPKDLDNNNSKRAHSTEKRGLPSS